ncbi:MAG: transketolase family protein [Halanaerobiales bacterium]
MREDLGRALAEYGGRNEEVVVLDADVSSSTKTCTFAEKYPDRFFNVGIAEPGMINLAVGLAMNNKIPFVSSFASILCYRGLEQIRTCVAYNDVNVKILSSYAGVSDYKDGPTHHAIFDLAIMRAMPNMTVLNPADGVELRELLPLAAEWDGPVYMRITRADVPEVFSEGLDVKIGEGRVIEEGTDLTIIVSGIMLNRALQAQKLLAKEGVSVRVVELHTLKPLDKELIIESAEKTGAIVTVEEHTSIGGLYGAVSEALAQSIPTPVVPVGINDRYLLTAPDEESIWDYCGLRPEDILQSAENVLKRK